MPNPTATVMIPYHALDDLIQLGSRADQPDAATLTPGTLYTVTDENNRIERSDGSVWALYSPTVGGGAMPPHHATHQPGGADALQLTAAQRLFGRGESGAGPIEELTLGTGLLITGTELRSTGGGVVQSYLWSFNTATAEPPTGNQIRFNAGHPYTAVTKVWIRYTTVTGENVKTLLLLLAAGATIYVQDKVTHAQFAHFHTTGVGIDKTDYVEFPVTWVNNGTALVSAQALVYLADMSRSAVVVGPESATDGALAAFDGVTGKVLQDSGVLTAGGHLGVGAAPDTNAVALFAGQYYSPLVTAGSSGTAKTIDWNLGNEHVLDLTASCTLTFANPVAGGRYVLLVRQTGAFTLTWPAAVRWPGGTAPVMTATAGKVDLFTFMYLPGGTPIYLGSYNQNY